MEVYFNHRWLDEQVFAITQIKSSLLEVPRQSPSLLPTHSDSSLSEHEELWEVLSYSRMSFAISSSTQSVLKP